MVMYKPINNRVYLFGTCLINQLYPDVGLAVINLLQQAGLKVIFPENQSCCGQPAYNSGFRKEALKVAKTQLKCFTRNYPIIVPSASCAGMLKHHWPELFKGDEDEMSANRIAGQVYELCEFLITHINLKPQDRGEPVTVAVHNSCSALREMKVAEHLTALLARLDNVSVVEHKYKTECCGFGGTFSIKQPDISGTMATDKAQALRQTKADIVISQDSGCLLNIQGVYAKQGSGPRCQHIAEFLLDRING